MEIFADPIFEWSQITGGYNWYNFTFVRFEVENDVMLGGIEATIVLLGLGVRVRLNYTETETLKKIKRDTEAIKAKLAADAPPPETKHNG